jgi:hypothetical protein
MSFLDQVLFYIQFQINKHGQYNGWTTPEDKLWYLTLMSQCFWFAYGYLVSILVDDYLNRKRRARREKDNPK